jgi:hypothetical protein
MADIEVERIVRVNFNNHMPQSTWRHKTRWKNTLRSQCKSWICWRTINNGNREGVRDEAHSIAAGAMNLPERGKLILSTNQDAFKKAAEDKGNVLEWQEEMKNYLQDGLDKEYRNIWWNIMTVTMQTLIEQHPDYLTGIKGNAIEHINASRSSMHQTTRAGKLTLCTIQVIIKLFTYKQQDQSLVPGRRHQIFKEHLDVLAPQLREYIFDQSAEEQIPDFSKKTITEQRKIQSEDVRDVIGYCIKE